MGPGIIGIVVFILLLIGPFYAFVLLMKGDVKKSNGFIHAFLITVYCLAWIIFFVGLQFNWNDHHVQIDPIDHGYSPISKENSFTFFTFLILSTISIYKIWTKGKKQAPLLLVIYVAFLIIGIVMNVFLAIQLSSQYDSTYYLESTGGYFMMIAPIVHVLVSLILLVDIVQEESFQAEERSFKNKFLNQLNSKIQKSKLLPIWSLIALLPIFVIVTLILILFGQEYDSLTKVFTETTTWHFSQETHPPYLNHQGHYLCTVAACGTPKIVKPIRLGIRNGEEIIVNRQLLIANAFEDIIMKKYPKLHTVIRRNYDKYGYPLSKDINTKRKSNITYILMKPLEWIFLVFIYLNADKPEKLIEEQYKRKSNSVASV